MKRHRRNIYVGLNPTGYPPHLLYLAAGCLYRWRWALTPVYVAFLAPPTGWALAIVWAANGARWLTAAYLVAAVCAGCWLTYGLRRPYDRVYAAIVLTIAAGWTLAVALHPGLGVLYGLWALSWPLIGLGWWCSATFRDAVALDGMRRRWTNVADLAGIAGAALLNVRTTAVGRILTVKLTGRNTVRDVNRERIEAGYQLRPGSVTVVRDKTNARRVDLHIVDRDPWESGRVVQHPAIDALAHLEDLTTSTDPDAEPDTSSDDYPGSEPTPNSDDERGQEAA